MLKKNDWYYYSSDEVWFEDNKQIIGSIFRIINVCDNPNYIDVEEWLVTKDRKFIHTGIHEGNDSVMLTKYGKKIKQPPKAFQILYSTSVNKNIDDCQETDTKNEYNEE